MTSSSPPSQSAPVLLDVVDSVATITLNRPEAMNGLDVATKDLLLETVQQVATDPRVVETLGSPVVLASQDIDGSLHVGDGARPDGNANLRIALRGPKGRAEARVTATLEAGKWSVDPVDIASPR